MDRFSQIKRALTVLGMAEPRGQGYGSVGRGTDFGRSVNPSQPGGQIMPYSALVLQIFRPSAIPVYTEPRIYL